MQPSSEHPTIWFWVAFPDLWVAISFFIAGVGGWAALVRAFRRHEPLPRDRWDFQSGGMRWWTTYSSVLTVGANPRGLFLSVTLPLFRVGHPPLFIPWTEISSSGLSGRWLWRWVELRLGRELAIPFRISPGLVERLKTAAGPAWPREVIG